MTVSMMFRIRFHETEFYSEKELLEYKKEADKWWKERHVESEEEYNRRILYTNRPHIHGVVKQNSVTIVC